MTAGHPERFGYAGILLLLVGGLFMFLSLQGSIERAVEEMRKTREFNSGQETRIMGAIRRADRRLQGLQQKVGIDPLREP